MYVFKAFILSNVYDINGLDLPKPLYFRHAKIAAEEEPFYVSDAGGTKPGNLKIN
jgi:hypothetical protein